MEAQRFWVEVKALGKKPTGYQLAWHAQERSAGGMVFVWDSLEGAVEDLRGLGFDITLPYGHGFRTKAISEAELQLQIKRMLKLLGFHVTDLSQGYRPGWSKRHRTTRITKGTPDLYCTRAARSQ